MPQSCISAAVTAAIGLNWLRIVTAHKQDHSNLKAAIYDDEGASALQLLERFFGLELSVPCDVQPSRASPHRRP